MDTKKANFSKIPDENKKRLSGLAMGLGIGVSTAAGATLGAVVNNSLRKQDYDLSDVDPEEPKEPLEPEENLADNNHQDNNEHTVEAQHLPKEEEEIGDNEINALDPKIDPNENANKEIDPEVEEPEPEPEPEIEVEPLQWYTVEGPDGEDVYLFLLGDPESGAAMVALGESVPGSGIYDVACDLTQDPIVYEYIDPAYTREELEMVIPNPERDVDPEPIIVDPIGPDEEEGEEDDDDGDDDGDDSEVDEDDLAEVIDDDAFDEDVNNEEQYAAIDEDVNMDNDLFDDSVDDTFII